MTSLSAINHARKIESDGGMNRPEIKESVNVHTDGMSRTHVTVTLTAGAIRVTSEADPLFYIIEAARITEMTIQARERALSMFRGVEQA